MTFMTSLSSLCIRLSKFIVTALYICSIPVRLFPPVSLITDRDLGQSSSKIVDDIVAAVSWLQRLGGDQDDVHQVTDEEEAQGGELEKTNGRIAQVEPVSSEHPQEDGEKEGSVKVVVIGPGAVHLHGEGVVAGPRAHNTRYGHTFLWSSSIVSTIISIYSLTS